MARRDLTGAVDFPKHLEGFAAGDEALIEEVLELFRQQADPVAHRCLDPAAGDGAWRDAAHSLKGSALGVGAFAVAKACEGGRAAAFERPLGVKAARLVDALRHALDRALAEHRRLRP